MTTTLSALQFGLVPLGKDMIVDLLHWVADDALLYLDNPHGEMCAFIHKGNAMSLLAQLNGEQPWPEHAWSVYEPDWPDPKFQASNYNTFFGKLADGELLALTDQALADMEDGDGNELTVIGYVFHAAVEHLVEALEPACDYNHYNDDELVLKPADFWVQDIDGNWTPLCAPCIAEFWKGGDREGQPFEIWPIRNIPAGPKRIKKLADR